MPCRTCRCRSGARRWLGDRHGLDDREIWLEYVNPVSRQSDFDVLTPGFRLNVCSPYRELSEADIDILREVAFRAANELISGGSTAAPYADSPDQEIAKKIHKTLKAARIKQPFVFNAAAGRIVNFTGFFGGEEETNDEGVPTQLDGFINSVVYRAKTLIFAFEVLGGGSVVDVEYSPRFRDVVHQHAGPEPSQVTICCQVHSSKKATGKVVKTYTLHSIGKVFDFWDWQEADLGAQLAESGEGSANGVQP